MIRPPPSVGDFVLAGQLVVAAGTREIIVLHLILAFLVHRDNHPPAIRLLAIEKDHLFQRAGHGDVELSVIILILKMPFALAEEESLDKIPKDMGDKLGGLVVVIQRRIIFIDAEGGKFVAQSHKFGNLADLLPIEAVR